jgi:hypothetical protein
MFTVASTSAQFVTAMFSGSAAFAGSAVVPSTKAVVIVIVASNDLKAFFLILQSL